MILPILVIFLVAVAVYLAFQKKLDTSNKIVIAGIAVLVLSLSYNYLKKQVALKQQAEGFKSKEELEDLAPEIEVFSPEYGEDGDETKEDYQDEDVEDAGMAMDTNDDDESADYSAEMGTHSLTELEEQFSENANSQSKSTLNSNYIKRENFGSDSKVNNARKLAGSTTSVKQSGIKGTGNIFTPQIIIKNDEGGTSSVGYKRSPRNDEQILWSQSRKWQEPDRDIWDGDEGLRGGLAKNRYRGNDPWDTIEDNMHRSQIQANKFKQNCQGTTCPFKERLTQKELAQIRGSKSKTHFPGYTILPPAEWDVPQPRPPSCIPDKWNRPAAVFDRGTPTNVLELDEDGKMLLDEDEVTFTNVGSILPRFKFEEYTEY